MKTYIKSLKEIIPKSFYLLLSILILMSRIPAQAQVDYFQFNPDNINIEFIITNPVNNNLFNNEGCIDELSATNKRWQVESLKMIISLIQQPILSKKALQNGPYDVIIVPGFPYSERKGARMILRARLNWAAYLVSEGIAKHVIFSGNAVYTPYVESRIMELLAIELGIPFDKIFCEMGAEHSTENVVYSYELAKKLGFNKIAVATGPFQSAFLASYVKDHSLPISFISISSSFKGKAGLVTFPHIDPSSAYIEDFVSLTERESRSERIQGSLGNNIRN